MALNHPQVFNRKDRLIEGWYWVMRSRHIRRGKIKPIQLMGKELVLFRGKDGQLGCLNAYCPHMGAHLAEGSVVGNSLKCLFHHWQFGQDGTCTNIPCQDQIPPHAHQTAWPVKEAYGLIWVWTGQTAKAALPIPAELEGQKVDWMVCNQFIKNCHPHVLLINAIDEQHFKSVHPRVKEIAGNIEFAIDPSDSRQIRFANQGAIPKLSWITKLLAKFYSSRTTYDMTYSFGSTGTVTLGPDFLHLYLMFALRPTTDGKTIGQTVVLTRKRKGVLGWIFNQIIMIVTWLAGMYFAHGDSKVFRTIQFQLTTPIKADRSIVAFIQHTEKQPLSDWLENASSANSNQLSHQFTPFKLTREQNQESLAGQVSD